MTVDFAGLPCLLVLVSLALWVTNHTLAAIGGREHQSARPRAGQSSADIACARGQ
jgi:hypothetical protein